VSFGRARAALGLAHDAHGLSVARDRAGELLLRSDPRLAAEFARDQLAPLEQLPAGSRARLTETLKAWLTEQGRLGPVAKRLGIHPQTVRYRLARLRELFGTALDEPEQRFWLELALRVTD
jgi:DNA-binding PucR family transcriptional regulator